MRSVFTFAVKGVREDSKLLIVETRPLLEGAALPFQPPTLALPLTDENIAKLQIGVKVRVTLEIG